MYLPNASHENLESILEQVHKNSKEVISRLTIDPTEILFQRGSDLAELSRQEGNLYLLTSGQLELTINEKSLLIYEQGDLVGVESLLAVSSNAIAKDFAVKAIVIPISLLQQQLGPSSLLSLISHFGALFMTAFAYHMPSRNIFEPDVRRYEAGEVIVEQGSFGDDIFTLVEGHADVFVDGNKVGEIMTDEVFGALAAMTNIGRTASIVSSGSALVISLKKDNLIELIKLRPGTIEKLIGDLARVIQDQNKRLSSLPEVSKTSA